MIPEKMGRTVTIRLTACGLGLMALLAGCGTGVPRAEFQARIPARWADTYKTDTLSTQERGLAHRGAIQYLYLPRDTTQRPQALAVVAVYDADAWGQVRTEGGPPPGDSVAGQSGLVFVVGLPQSNPFFPGSVDALRFDSLQLTADEKGKFVALE
jgi:hypothetical protein